MTSQEFAQVMTEIQNMSAAEIADAIMFEEMTAEQADQFTAAIPAEMVSQVMHTVE